MVTEIQSETEQIGRWQNEGEEVEGKQRGGQTEEWRELKERGKGMQEQGKLGGKVGTDRMPTTRRKDEQESEDRLDRKRGEEGLETEGQEEWGGGESEKGKWDNENEEGTLRNREKWKFN